MQQAGAGSSVKWMDGMDPGEGGTLLYATLSLLSLSLLSLAASPPPPLMFWRHCTYAFPVTLLTGLPRLQGFHLIYGLSGGSE